ncbi:hypothetical protein I4U23_025989 [Adineta vaga]|nr:hypothetical protein I4U23_025989 [Adineta vaga]
MNDIDIINTLRRIIISINDIFPLILLIIGTFGHICNLLIFSKPNQRKNPTSLYFFANTITNLIALYLGMLIRYLQDIANIDLVNSYLVICKLRSYFLYLSFSLSNWYIVLATIDRYLISSENNNRRRLSTLKNTYFSIGFTTILFSLTYCHILILYNIQSSSCYPQFGFYRIFNDIQLIIQFSLLPPLIMAFFGLLTIQNIRSIQGRIGNTRHAHLRQRDIQLSKMLLLQVIITIVCSLPLIITQLISTMTTTVVKSILRLTIENFASQIGRHLAFSNCSISFYLYTLAGSEFRLEARHMVNRFSMFLCHRRILERRQIGIDPRPVILSTREAKRQQ